VTLSRESTRHSDRAKKVMAERNVVASPAPPPPSPEPRDVTVVKGEPPKAEEQEYESESEMTITAKPPSNLDDISRINTPVYTPVNGTRPSEFSGNLPDDGLQGPPDVNVPTAGDDEEVEEDAQNTVQGENADNSNNSHEPEAPAAETDSNTAAATTIPDKESSAAAQEKEDSVTINQDDEHDAAEKGVEPTAAEEESVQPSEMPKDSEQVEQTHTSEQAPVDAEVENKISPDEAEQEKLLEAAAEQLTGTEPEPTATDEGVEPPADMESAQVSAEKPLDAKASEVAAEPPIEPEPAEKPDKQIMDTQPTEVADELPMQPEPETTQEASEQCTETEQPQLSEQTVTTTGEENQQVAQEAENRSGPASPLRPMHDTNSQTEADATQDAANSSDIVAEDAELAKKVAELDQFDVTENELKEELLEEYAKLEEH
jgi:hypothetical protein